MPKFNPGPGILLLLIAVLTGCTPVAASAPADADSTKPTVLTTFTVLADMAREVAGEHLRVESITKVGAEIHGYEPTPGDLRTAGKADLILDNGLGLEAWFERFVDQLDVDHVVVSAGIEPIAIAEDTDAGLTNPHAWMSPLNAIIYVTNIERAFSELDPANSAHYRANADSYTAKLNAIHTDLVSELGALPINQRALVTCEGAFSYLARDVGLTEAYLWAVNAEQQATPRQVAATIGFVRDNAVPAVFCESTVSSAAMERVAAESGAEFAGTLYVDSLSEADGPVPSYLDLLRYDARVIVAGLTGTAMVNGS